MHNEKSKLVYSTEQAVPKKGKSFEKASHAGLHPVEQRVTVRIERKGRCGKSVTVIEGLKVSQNRREEFLKQLKSNLGTGGTLKDDSIEIQGNHRDAIIAMLEKMGFRPKRSGG